MEVLVAKSAIGIFPCKTINRAPELNTKQTAYRWKAWWVPPLADAFNKLEVRTLRIQQCGSHPFTAVVLNWEWTFGNVWRYLCHTGEVLLASHG